MGRLSRFLHLEKARPDPTKPHASEAPDGEDPGATSGRFEGVQTDASDLTAARSGSGTLARFDEAQPSAELRLDEKRRSDQPFIRCAGCEGDNNKFASVCAHCERPLDTAEQRAFNERLWAEREATARQEEEAAAVAATAAAADAAHTRSGARPVSGASKEAWEAMARQVKQDTLLRLGEPGNWSRWHRGRTVRDWPPVFVAAVTLFLAWFVLGIRSPSRLLIAAVIGGTVAAVFRILRR